MKLQHHSRRARGASSVVALLLGLGGGCAMEDVQPQSDTSEHVASRDVALTLASDEQDASNEHGMSPRPVAVNWSDSEPSQRGELFEVDLINISERPIKVDLELNAESPSGEVESVPLGARQLGPNSSRTVKVPMARLPVQTVGAATAINVVARYETKLAVDFDQDGITSAGGAQQAMTDARYVTFDDTRFAAAVLRTSDEQARENGLVLSRGKAPSLTALRTLDPQTRRAVDLDIDEGAPDAPQPSLVFISDEGPE